jgi:tRNA(fMet)-specific endonuclease VapC
VKTLLVDTSVVSYLLKEHSLAAPYRERLEGNLLGVSFMTIAELYCWPLQRGWGEKRFQELKAHLSQYVVLAHDDAMSWEWARLVSQKGRPMSFPDAWIGATALRYGVPLVTHNARHFDHIAGLEIITVSKER